MKKIALIFAMFVCICVMMGVGTSCKKEVFDEQTYIDIVDTLSPVDEVDQNHTWTLTTKKTLIVNVNASTGARTLQVLTADPKTTKDAEIIAQKQVSDGDQFSMNISYPQRLTTLYAAIIDNDGNYTVMSFKPSSTNRVDFSKPIYTGQKIENTPTLQYYAFCYEEELPKPGDYDFNDVVMHLALNRTAEKEMRIHVRLSAVGASIQMAGLIRLPEIAWDDVDTVFTVNNESFNVNMHGDEIKSQNSYVEDAKMRAQILLEGKSGEPVINLFADANWAIGEARVDENGLFNRKQYNVSYGATTTTAETMPREIVFVLRVKDPLTLSYLTLEDIDPFVMKLDGNARREIHTFPYRKVDALYQNKYVDTKNLPWALVVPMASFYHPLHAKNIGFRMKNEYTQQSEVLYGAYRTKGHSFGEWSVNHNNATDWYLHEYATTSEVYIW